MQQLRYDTEDRANFAIEIMQRMEYDIVCISSKYNFSWLSYTTEDVAQIIRIHLWEKLENYNPTRTADIPTWCRHVINNKVLDLNRMARAKKRPKGVVSYDAILLQEFEEE